MTENVNLRNVETGRWAVVTTSGSEYTVDFGAKTLTRHRAQPDNELSEPLRRDDETVELIAVLHCQEGYPAVFLIDLHVEGVAATNRNTTRVASIAQLA